MRSELMPLAEAEAGDEPGPAPRPGIKAVLKRPARVIGAVLIVAGVLCGSWVLTVWLWQDPFTALYTKYEQGKLAQSLERQFQTYPRRREQSSSLAGEKRRIAIEAAGYRRTARHGQAIGRIIVPRLHLNMVIVNGTDEDSLTKGPGRYLGSAMPGQGQLVYIAGHRTTYLAPFSAIDTLRRGDRVTIEMPYATFVYRVTGARIVPAGDLAVLRSPRHELLELQACNPRFFATERYIAYALPAKVVARYGRPYTAELQPGRRRLAAGRREP